MSLPTLAFRVDAGKVAGLSFGHLYRCLALASELSDSFGCRFVMAEHPEGTAVARRAGFPVDLLREDGAGGIPLGQFRGARVVVIDLPGHPGALVQGLEAAGVATVVLDDTGGKELAPALLVNGSPAEEQRRYGAGSSPGQSLLGPGYCIMGREFDAPPPRRDTAHPLALALFMGGSDPAGLTLKLLTALTCAGCSHPLSVLLGSGFGSASLVEQALQAYPGAGRLVQAPESVAPLLAQADLALLAGGRSSCEAAALGVPALLLPSIEHEEAPAAALERAGIHRRIRHAWRLPQTELNLAVGRALGELLDDPERLRLMSRRGRELFDGGGRRRVAEAIKKMCSVL